MPTYVKHLVFAKATGVETQDIDTIGFRGTAAVFWTTKQTATGLATDLRWTTGLTDGTDQVSGEGNWPDGSGSPTGTQAESQSTILQFRSVGGTSPVASATFGGFTANGFTLDWTVNDGSADLIHVLVMRCTESALITVPTTGTAGGDTQDVTVGFQPDLIVWMPGQSTDGVPYATADDDVSFQVPSFSQPSAPANHMARIFAQTNGPQNEGSANDAIRVVIQEHNIFLGSTNEALQVTALTADGFTLTNNASFGVVNHTHFALCLRGFTNFQAGEIVPSGTGDLAVSLGFQPSVVLMHLGEGAFHPASFSVGAWDAIEGQAVATLAAGIDSGSSVAVRRETADAIIRTVTPAAGGSSTDHNVGEIASASGTGFTLHMTSFGGGSPSIGYIAFGSDVIPGSSNNLLTGEQHAVTGSDNFVAGALNTVAASVSEAHGTLGTVTGDQSVLFSQDGLPHTVSDDGVFEVDANDIRHNGRSVLELVTGPGSSTDRGIVTWNGTDGLEVRDTPAPTIPSDGRIANVTDPTSAQDAATKAYVDAHASTGTWIPLVDGSEPPNFITDGAGRLILVATP